MILSSNISCSALTELRAVCAAILSFITSQLFKKWFQCVHNVLVEVHSFMVNTGSTVRLALQHITLQSLCHAAESGELCGDFCHFRLCVLRIYITT
jgi:hypothetical protein